MGGGCRGVVRLMFGVRSSCGIMVLSIGRSGLNSVVWWVSCGIVVSSTFEHGFKHFFFGHKHYHTQSIFFF